MAALWIGVVAGGEGWNLTHHEGMVEAQRQLPYLDWYARENVLPFSGDIAKKIDEAVNVEKADVVVLNSFSQRDEMMKKADEYPHVKFLNCSGDMSNGHNAMSYDGHIEQSWWVAGRVAGSKAKHRIGYIGSFITPEVVRYITAFYLGARSVNPTIKLDVQWLGFWIDYKTSPSYTYKSRLTNDQEVRVFREELLTYRLIDAGAEVVAHATDSQRAVRLVERLTRNGTIRDISSISNDNRNGYRELTGDLLPNGPPMQSCLGSPYWNWAPLYIQMFDEIHRQTWRPEVNRIEVMRANPAHSVPGFNLNPNVGIDDSSVRSHVAEIVEKGWEYAFNGPYETNGRDRDGDGDTESDEQFFADGEKMSENEYQTMCWFPKGIVEKSDPTDPKSPDVDARVPDAERAKNPKFVADIEGPPGVPPGVGINCRENL